MGDTGGMEHAVTSVRLSAGLFEIPKLHSQCREAHINVPLLVRQPACNSCSALKISERPRRAAGAVPSYRGPIIRKGPHFMKLLSLAVGTLSALAIAGASAQSMNLTAIYTCVDMCRGGLPAHITQNRPELNLLTEAGVPA